MTSSSPSRPNLAQSGRPDAPAGLRERKKAKTRAAIQREAMRLFREQGYGTTTIEQIADAAEVSPSTLFRYYPTKEALVLTDEFDPLLIEIFRTQPADLSPVQAFRAAIREVLGDLPPEAYDEILQRHVLAGSVPELRAAMMDQYVDAIQMMSGLIGERLGRAPDDIAVRALAGAMVGVMMACALDFMQESLPMPDFLRRMDESLALLDSGLPRAP